MVERNYVLKVNNKRGDGSIVNVALYQQYPGQSGSSLIWVSEKVSDGGKGQFSWGIDWGLTWGKTERQIAPGVYFEAGGALRKVKPLSYEKNSCTIDFKDGSFMISEADINSGLEDGQLQVTTTGAFKVSDSKLMQIAVCVGEKPVFVMNGQPSATFTFSTTPTYYICITDRKVGTVVSGTMITNPTEIVFKSPGTLEYDLTDNNKFVPSAPK